MRFFERMDIDYYYSKKIQATPEQYHDLKKELESLDYDLDILN